MSLIRYLLAKMLDFRKEHFQLVVKTKMTCIKNRTQLYSEKSSVEGLVTNWVIPKWTMGGLVREKLLKTDMGGFGEQIQHLPTLYSNCHRCGSALVSMRIRIRILGQCRSGCESGSRSRSRAWTTKSFKKFTAVKNNILWSKIAIYLSLGLRKEHPNYRKCLQPSKENIQHFKTWIFFTFFYYCG